MVGTVEPAVPGGRASARLALVYWAGVLVMIATIWGLAALESATVRLAREARQVRQEDIWRLDARGVITVLSRVHYTRWPGRKESVSYALPYTEARVLGARVAGQTVQVRMIGAGTFELVWPERLPELPRVVEVAWAMPIEALEGADRGYVARLQAFVPVTAYALGLVLEADSGYEFERAPERRETVLFSILDTGRAPGRGFGTTGIGLRRKAAADAAAAQ
jgi:hypothetical protein